MFIKVRNDLVINTDHVMAIDTESREIFFSRSIVMDGEYVDSVRIGDDNHDKWRELLRALSAMNVRVRP